MRFYYRISKLFQGSHLIVKFFALNQTIPFHKYDLVITDQEYIHYMDEPKVLRLNLNQIEPLLITKIIGLIVRKREPKFKQVIVGVDPGEQIGLAAICDGMILAADTSRLRQLSKKIEEFIILFPSELVVIRIGDQPTSVSKIIFNKLFTVFSNIDNIKIEIVKETNSNLRKITPDGTFGPDEAAAITIAHRSGKRQNHLVRTKIPSGRIKEIQKWSRKLSYNRITLDAELAHSVALGKISLEEAIKQKEKQIEVKKYE